MIDVILKKPGQKAEIVAIENSLEAMQKAVGGYIETVTVLPHLTVVCNEEGLLLDMPYNCEVFGIPFVGPVIVAGVDGDEFCSMPRELSQTVLVSAFKEES